MDSKGSYPVIVLLANTRTTTVTRPLVSLALLDTAVVPECLTTINRGNLTTYTVCSSRKLKQQIFHKDKHLRQMHHTNNLRGSLIHRGSDSRMDRSQDFRI